MNTFRTRQQLAQQLGISCRTLTRTIQRLQLNIPPRRLLSPEDQKKIYSALGCEQLKDAM